MSRTLQIKYRRPTELSPLDINPRKIPDENLAALANSIKANPDFFEARPLLLSDRTGKLVIIAGCQRFRAAQIAGMKRVPTILLTGLSTQREKEITVRDNVNNGLWDFDVLQEHWTDLPLNEWGMDIAEMVDIDLDDFFEEVEKEPAPETHLLSVNFKNERQLKAVMKKLLAVSEELDVALLTVLGVRKC